MNRIQEILNRLSEIRSSIDTADATQISAFETEIRELTAEKELIEKRAALASAMPSAQTAAVAVVSANPTTAAEKRSHRNVNEFTGSMEYREAFMNYCKAGTPFPTELRADAFSATTDATALIPSTIVAEVIRKMKTYGQIFARVRKTNIRGGMSVPILSLSPVANWITESAVSDRQKVQSNSSVTFSYHGLECRVAVSLLAETVTLDEFETTIIGLIVEAMTKALDIAIIKGSGTGSPLGITTDPRVTALTAQVITLTPTEFSKWDEWKKKVFAKIPLSYRAGGTFIMAAGTFEGYIDGMVDTTGQPIGRVNHGITEGPQERFGGREVLLVEDDVIAPYDTATTGTIVAVYCKLSDYVINSNMQFQMHRWLDHDTNQWVDKAILIADGKILDPNGVIIVKKGAAV